MARNNSSMQMQGWKFRHALGKTKLTFGREI
jgi:hypothetical protein